MKYEFAEQRKDKFVRYTIDLNFDTSYYEAECYNSNKQLMCNATFGFYDSNVWLWKIETKKGFEHQGAASVLIRFLEYFSVTNGKTRIEGKYYPENEFAKPFYKKHHYFIPNQTKTWEHYDETWTLFKNLNNDEIMTNVAPKIKVLEDNFILAK